MNTTHKVQRKGPRPVGFFRALAIVVECGRRQAPAAFSLRVAKAEAPAPEWKTCPACGKRGEVGRDFGTRRIRGQARPQSWCRACRRSKDARPRQPSLFGSELGVGSEQLGLGSGRLDLSSERFGLGSERLGAASMPPVSP